MKHLKFFGLGLAYRLSLLVLAFLLVTLQVDSSVVTLITLFLFGVETYFLGAGFMNKDVK